MILDKKIIGILAREIIIHMSANEIFLASKLDILNCVYFRTFLEGTEEVLKKIPLS